MNCKHLLFALAIISTLFTACESEESASVDQNKIYTTYELLYDQNTDKTYARAQFRFGNALGTILQLSAPAEVRFNNDVLDYKPILAYYEKEYAGKITSGTFTYEGTDGVAYSNSVNGLPNIDFPANFTAVTRNQANDFAWTGSPLAAREEVFLFLRNTTTTNLQTFYTNAVGATKMVLSAEKLNNLAPGVAAEADLYRDRIDSLSQKTSAGGYLKVNYRTKKKSITVN
ncbi:MAG: hypothetical protein ACK4TA_15100 [Saprospiraceae bacterium]